MKTRNIRIVEVTPAAHRARVARRRRAAYGRALGRFTILAIQATFAACAVMLAAVLGGGRV